MEIFIYPTKFVLAKFLNLKLIYLFLGYMSKLHGNCYEVLLTFIRVYTVNICLISPLTNIINILMIFILLNRSQIIDIQVCEPVLNEHQSNNFAQKYLLHNLISQNFINIISSIVYLLSTIRYNPLLAYVSFMRSVCIVNRHINYSEYLPATGTTEENNAFLRIFCASEFYSVSIKNTVLYAKYILVLIFIYNSRLYGNIPNVFVSSAVTKIFQINNEIHAVYQVFCKINDLQIAIMLYSTFHGDCNLEYMHFVCYFMLFFIHETKTSSLAFATRPHHICNAVGRCHIRTKYCFNIGHNIYKYYVINMCFIIYQEILTNLYFKLPHCWHIICSNEIITVIKKYKTFNYHVLLQQMCFGTIFVHIYDLYFYHNVIELVGNLSHSINIFLYIIVHIEYTVVQLHYNGRYVHYTFL